MTITIIIIIIIIIIMIIIMIIVLTITIISIIIIAIIIIITTITITIIIFSMVSRLRRRPTQVHELPQKKDRTESLARLGPALSRPGYIVLAGRRKAG